MSGSFSKSKQSASSQQTSSGQSFNTSNSFSDSLGQSAAQGTSNQSVAFEQLFQQLFGNATGAAQRASEMIPGLEEKAGQLFSTGAGFLEKLQGNAGADYLANRLTGANPQVDEQIDLLGEDIGGFLRNEVNPMLTSNAVRAGGLGGGRQGVAQGRASAAALEQFQRGASGIRTADLAARDQAAAQLGGLTNQAAGTGLGSLGAMLGLGESGANAALSPYMALSQVMGGPTVLTQQQNTASSQDMARAIANSLGFSFDESQGTSTSKGKSMSVSGGLW